MNNDITPMSSDLFRQRRNLLVLSSIFLFIKYAGIVINKFTFLGIEFGDFRNPKAIYLSIWVFWFYYFVRYYQYFAQEGLKKIKEAVIETIDKKSKRKIKDIVNRKYPRNMREDVTYSILKKWNWTYHGQYPDLGSEKIVDLIFTGDFALEIKRSSLISVIISSVAAIIFQQSVLTDYLLPIIIAIITLIYCAHGWEGSLINIFKTIFT